MHVEQTYLPSSSRHVKRFLKSRSEFIKILDANGYTLLSQYKGVDEHSTVLCPEGHKWTTCCYTNFKTGVRCRVCNKQCPENTKEKFYINLEKEGYIRLEEYVNSRTNISVICPNGHQWNTCNPERFNNGARCRVCDGQCPEEGKKRFNQLIKERGDQSLSDYKGANRKVVIKFSECRHIVDTLTPSEYKNRGRCPVCSQSRKESYLASFTKNLVKEKYIDARFEYRILKNTETQYFLPFDIFIPSVNTLIEVQGQQHYNYNTLYHRSVEDFEKRKKLDEIKRNWAIGNGYNFIEIDIRKHTEESVTKLINTLN